MGVGKKKSKKKYRLVTAVLNPTMEKWIRGRKKGAKKSCLGDCNSENQEGIGWEGKEKDQNIGLEGCNSESNESGVKKFFLKKKKSCLGDCNSESRHRDMDEKGEKKCKRSCLGGNMNRRRRWKTKNKRMAFLAAATRGNYPVDLLLEGLPTKQLPRCMVVFGAQSSASPRSLRLIAVAITSAACLIHSSSITTAGTKLRSCLLTNKIAKC